MKNIFKNKIVLALIIIATLALAGMAVYTAVKLNQTKEESISPARPESKPQAQETVRICDIMLVADVSSSMSRREFDNRLKLDWAKDAMSGLVNSLIPANTASNIYMGLAYFEGASSRSGLPQGLTTNLSSLLNPIQALSFQGGPGTCIECGLKLANDEIFANSTHASKHVILLSDGCGNRLPSGSVASTAIAKANALALANEGRSGGITYYTVGYGNDSAPPDINGCRYSNETLIAIAGSAANFSYKPDVQDWAQTFINIVNQACPVVVPTSPPPTTTAPPGACPVLSFSLSTPTATATATSTATATATSTSTASPTATPSPTATSTPGTTLVSCNGSCDASSDCKSGLTCSDGVCRNPNCLAETDCTCPVSQATTEPSMPNAGVSLPTVLGISTSIFLLIISLALAL